MIDPRITFIPRQRLLAADMQAAHDRETALRGLHIRTLHDAWGVAAGLGLHLRSNRLQVVVEPGLAYDSLGREITLSGPLALDCPQLPGAAGEQDCQLLVSWNEAPRPQSPGCAPRSPHLPAFRWAFDGDRLRPGLDIVLGRLTLADGKAGSLQTGERPIANPLTHPYIATGRMALKDARLESSDDVMARAWIDTSAGGFTGTPLYFVSLQAEKWDDIYLHLDLPILIHRVFGPRLSVTEPERSRFRLQISGHWGLAMKNATLVWLGMET